MHLHIYLHPEIIPVIQIHHENEWLGIENLLQKNNLELKGLLEQQIPTVGKITESAGKELSRAQEELNEKEVVVAKLLNSLEMERGEVRAIETRIEKIEEDILRNKDAKTIHSLGSIAPNIAQQICPTCHQPIEDTLMPLADEQHVMSLDDNLSFLEEQRRTFKASLKNTNQPIPMSPPEA